MTSRWWAFLILALACAGCARGTTQTQGTAPAATAVTADAARGEAVFRKNCSTCHVTGSTGGGIGPALAGEKTRRNYDQTVAWIKSPDPPMPKLFPYPLSERDVADVAAYVQSL